MNPSDTLPPSPLAYFERLRDPNDADPALAAFRHHLEFARSGADGFLPENAIDPVSDLPDMDRLDNHIPTGLQAMSRSAVLKLNGGLGTGMGLEAAKSLLEVRDGLTFLDLIVRQILALRASESASIPLVLMNSGMTAADSLELLARYSELPTGGLPPHFLQNVVPKILADSLEPAVHEADPRLQWCPPGHGDLYVAIAASGMLEQLIDSGIDYIFVSNADNLGAVLDPVILGFMEDEGLDFILEAADRTDADRKGGHLCRLHDGRLALRESAQCPPEAADSFQDIRRYSYFNTNNIWLRLPALAELVERSGGFLPLPTIVNRKTLDPRDATSPAVIQLETAMGSAISLFERAAAVRVPRRRFSPVKNTNDLLGVRSDAFELTEDWRVVLHRDRSAPPVVNLDGRYFKMIDDFEARFPSGAPSLFRCDSLAVEGDVTFGAKIVAEGDVVVRAAAPASIADGTILAGTVDL
jgi:UTP--glucose-1-phosphate uridylyltransferase